MILTLGQMKLNRSLEFNSSGSSGSSRITKAEIIFFCQLAASFCVLVTALLNLSLSSRDKELWASLAGASFTYLIPCPKKGKRKDQLQLTSSSSASNNGEQLSIFHHADKQCIDDGRSICGEHGGSVLEQTSSEDRTVRKLGDGVT